VRNGAAARPSELFMGGPAVPEGGWVAQRQGSTPFARMWAIPADPVLVEPMFGGYIARI
jgi:hypothetical protein